VAERQVVVEEVPVFPVREADVRLEDQEPASWPEDPMRLAQRGEDVVLAREVLEDVAREDDVDARRRPSLPGSGGSRR